MSSEAAIVSAFHGAVFSDHRTGGVRDHKFKPHPFQGLFAIALLWFHESVFSDIEKLSCFSLKTKVIQVTIQHPCCLSHFQT